MATNLKPIDTGKNGVSVMQIVVTTDAPTLAISTQWLLQLKHRRSLGVTSLAHGITVPACTPDQSDDPTACGIAHALPIDQMQPHKYAHAQSCGPAQ